MNIIFMEPVYKDYIWGGNKIKNILNKDTPYNLTAESWEISANKNGICKLKNDEYKNKTLKDIFETEEVKEKIFGKKCKDLKEFPILIKFIDARENLSIQVHPDDEYAQNKGFEFGKNEMWYVMETNQEGKIIGGLNEEISKQQLKDVIEHNEIKKYLNYINIQKGDSIYIPSGTVHAILKDTMICEIQQNCDITYRIYDWDRKDKNGNFRPLHKKEAIDTINTESMPLVVKTLNEKEVQTIAKSKNFEVKKVNCKKIFEDNSDVDTFYAINVINGKGEILYNDKKWNIKMGDSFIIPANLGRYKVIGEIQFLKSYVI